ncbi:MAG: hypothetical protein AAF512_12115, partial [Pseudomonadota bacterium]
MKLNTRPLFFEGFTHGDDDPSTFSFEIFPEVIDFQVTLVKTAVFGYQIEYRSKQHGCIADFPWWDNVDRDLKSIGDIPSGTFQNPYDEFEQGWQIYIFQHEDFIYILEGESPACTEFP